MVSPFDSTTFPAVLERLSLPSRASGAAIMATTHLNHYSTGDTSPLVMDEASLETSTLKRHETQQDDALSEAAAPLPWYMQVVNSLIYGMINTIACIPVLYGYAQIVFGNDVYGPYLPMLAKLFIISSAIHQTVFCLFSTLPFAVGQVQDAGLIFLAHIATSIVTLLHGKHPPKVIVATALVVLPLGTALLGVCLMVLGKLKLARMISYLPLPVIGGQIVFIALFCVRAGVSLCISKDLPNLTAWAQLLHDEHSVVLVVPGLVAGAALAAVSLYIRSALALPLAMLAVPACFYMILWVTGSSMDDARAAGWLGPANVPASFQEALSLYRVHGWFSGDVQWWVIPYQCLTWVGMVFVVAFSSCLDIVAIEMDGGKPLNKNRELYTVGLSNLIAGACGGFTGSYIFSQTIFTFRTRTTSRLCGWVLVAAEVVVFIMNVDMLSYIPLFFFAATLHFIAILLLIEWIWEVRHRMTSTEYLVLWCTFLGNLAFGIIPGFAVGIVLAMAMFIVSYVKATARSAQPIYRQRSRVVRLREHRRLLDQDGRILTVELIGAIFFGSSVDTLDHIKALLGVQENPKRRSGRGRTRTSSFAPSSWWSRLVNMVKRGEQPRHARRENGDYPAAAEAGSLNTKGPLQSVVDANASERASLLPDATHAHTPPSSSRQHTTMHPSYDTMGTPGTTATDVSASVEEVYVTRGDAHTRSPLSTEGDVGLSAAEGEEGGGGREAEMETQREMLKKHAEAAAKLKAASDMNGEVVRRRRDGPQPRFLVLDFRRVTAIDMSSIANCFLPLQALCRELRVVLVYCNCNPRVEFYLRSNRLIDDTNTHLFSTLLMALEYCETMCIAEEAIATHGHSLRARAFSMRGHHHLTLVQVMRTMLLQQGLELSSDDVESGGDSGGVAEGDLNKLREYVREEDVAADATIFYPEEPADSFYLVLQGEVGLETPDMSHDHAAVEDANGLDTSMRAGHPYLHSVGERSNTGKRRLEVVLHTGALFGFVDFYLEQHRRFYARALTQCKLAVFTEEALGRLEAENPRLLVLVQRIVLKQFAMELGNVSAL